MAVAFVRSHTGMSIKTAGTTNAYVNISTLVPAGNVLVAYFTFDNAATASKPVTSSIARAAGETNTWLAVGGARSTSTTAGSFAQGEVWAIRTSVDWPVAQYTVTLDTTTVMKATGVDEFSGALAVLRSTAGGVYSTTTTAASAATTGTTPVIGDLAIGFIWGSNIAAAPAGDTDTLGGAWVNTSGVGSTGGNAATNNFGLPMYKILTAASHQTVNSSALGSAGNGAIVAILQQYVPPAITQAASRFYADGTETASTALAAQDATPTVDVSSGDVNAQVRVRLQSTTAVAVDPWDDFQLQWEKNASGTWASIPAPLLEYTVANTQTAFVSNITNSGNGQSFVGNGQPLTGAQFHIFRDSTVTGDVRAVLYAHTGTYGSGGVGTGTALATSNTRTRASLTTTPGQWEAFVFDGTYTLANGTPFVILLQNINSVTGNITVRGDSAGSHSGNQNFYNGSTWSVSTGNDVLFRIETPPVPQSVVPYNSPNLTDAAATTNRLTGGTGTFTAGKISEDGLADDVGWAGNNYTELLYSLTFKQADLANSDTIRFRVLRNGVTTGLTYTATPTVTITKTPPADITQAAYQFYADGTETGSTALATQNTAPTVDITGGDANLQLRTRLQSTSAVAVSATDDFQLQWEKNASGTWTSVSSPLAYTTATSPTTQSKGAVEHGYGQSFLGNGSPLLGVRLMIARGSGVTGTIAASLYAHTGTYGAAGATGTGSPLATSTSLTTELVTSVQPTYQWVEFTFDGTFTLQQDVPYVIRYRVLTTTGLIYVQYENLRAHPGTMQYYSGSVWTAYTGFTALFNVITAAPVVPYYSANLTDAAATTNRLTGGTGTFTAGKISEDGLVDDVGWAGNNYTELLYSLTLKKAGLTNADSLRFRVLHNGATTGLTYTQYPSITIGTAANPKISTLTDSFDTLDTTTKWTVGGSGASVAASQLVLVTGNPGSTAVDSKSFYDLTESSVSFMFIPPTTGSANRSTEVSLITQDESGLASFRVYGATTDLLMDFIDGVGDVQWNITGYDRAAYKWLRIRLIGSTMYWDYSANGVAWTNAHSTAVASTTPFTATQIHIYTSQVAAEGSGGTSYLDYLNLPAPPPKIDTFIDSFDSQVDPAVWTKYGSSVSGWQAPGVMYIGSDTLSVTGYTSVATYDLTDSSIYFKMTPAVNYGFDETNFRLVAAGVGSLYASWWTASPAVGIQGASPTGITISGKDTTSAAWMRIRATGTTVYWDTSPDGITWTQGFTTTSTIPLTALNLQFENWRDTTDASSKALLDSINTVPAAVSMTPKNIHLVGNTALQRSFTR